MFKMLNFTEEKWPNFIPLSVYFIANLDVGLLAYLLLQFFFSNDEWCIILSYSLLLPQIIHNIRLGAKPSFEWLFIIGFVSVKIFLPLYERGCP